MKKALIFAICALLLLCTLVSCNQAGNGTEKSSDAPETLMDLIRDGKTEYVIVRPDETSDEVKQAAVRLRNAINEKYGTEIQLKNDFEKRDFDISQRHPYEILVGATNREESAAALSDIGYLDTLIRVSGTRLVITGGCDSATTDAVDRFISTYLTGSDLSLPEHLSDKDAKEYARPGMTIGGTPLSEFRIIYGSRYRDTANTLADRIGRMTGAVVRVFNDGEAVSDHEIVLGSAKRGTTTTFSAPDDFSVTGSGASLILAGGSEYAVATAAARFLQKLKAAPVNAALTDLELSYQIPDRSVYAQDPSQLALHWEFDYQPEEWMLDFDEKYAAILDPNGRMMSCLHRGDMVYYPENSLEGYISAVRMGGDMIEIDPRLTKDGVFVLMHDATLSRTTDFDQKCGKNGLPTSEQLCDWTYDQLMQLNLKTKNGGSGSTVTPYKIPTLEEAFRVAAGKVFIRLDVKGPSDGVMFWNYERDIWPLIEKYGGYQTVIFTWHNVFYRDNYSLVKTYKAKQIAACGKSSVHFLGCGASRTAAEALAIIKANKFDPVVRLTDYNWSAQTYQDYLSVNQIKLRAFRGNARLYIDANANGTNITEEPEVWDALFDAGINILLINKGLDFCRYIRDNYQPEAYTK